METVFVTSSVFESCRVRAKKMRHLLNPSPFRITAELDCNRRWLHIIISQSPGLSKVDTLSKASSSYVCKVICIWSIKDASPKVTAIRKCRPKERTTVPFFREKKMKGHTTNFWNKRYHKPLYCYCFVLRVLYCTVVTSSPRIRHIYSCTRSLDRPNEPESLAPTRCVPGSGLFESSHWYRLDAWRW